VHAVPQAPFWTNPLTEGEHTVVYYFLVLAGLAMLAQTLRTWVSLGEIGPRHRPAMFASLAVTAVAFLSYVELVVKFDVGYGRSGGTATGADSTWLPNKDAIWSWAPRYMDWSVTVPLLTVELVALSTLVGLAATRMRGVLMASAFLMILTGYLGGVVIDDGRSLAALWTWGLVSGAFMVVIYAGVFRMAVLSRGMPRESRSTFRLACGLLMVSWLVYPVVFGLQGWTGHEGGWTAVAQIALSVTDVVAKVGFGAYTHKLAKLRTAEEVAAGEPHPEAVWVSSIRKSDAALPADAAHPEHGPAARAAGGSAAT
jgi:bacteriorhodopsin